MSKAFESLNKFQDQIVDKPEEANFTYKGKWDDLIMAVKNLAKEKSICLVKAQYGIENFKNFRTCIKARARAQKFAIGAVEKGANVYVYRQDSV